MSARDAVQSPALHLTQRSSGYKRRWAVNWRGTKGPRVSTEGSDPHATEKTPSRLEPPASTADVDIAQAVSRLSSEADR